MLRNAALHQEVSTHKSKDGKSAISARTSMKAISPALAVKCLSNLDAGLLQGGLKTSKLSESFTGPFLGHFWSVSSQALALMASTPTCWSKLSSFTPSALCAPHSALRALHSALSRENDSTKKHTPPASWWHREGQCLTCTLERS